VAGAGPHVDGRVSKTGGRVVENVTGYDLAKLYTGSLGTLAVIAEISFKLKAQFPKTSTAIAEFPNLQEALAVLGGIRKSPLQPIACELAGRSDDELLAWRSGLPLLLNSLSWKPAIKSPPPASFRKRKPTDPRKICRYSKSMDEKERQLFAAPHSPGLLGERLDRDSQPA
jgi:hypothetical protein